ncbi:hypothetical protein VP01_4396g2 [Puccinia sorghi]|uniref:Uncharacterized protein n=1 Tax=Puccinia sorghi TaxID=27349 RepID=A0A0L6URM9_9BASI|nr:hypothetical protein VP01_4396g2 [Puccinia sorghi]
MEESLFPDLRTILIHQKRCKNDFWSLAPPDLKSNELYPKFSDKLLRVLAPHTQTPVEKNGTTLIYSFFHNGTFQVMKVLRKARENRLHANCIHLQIPFIYKRKGQDRRCESFQISSVYLNFFSKIQSSEG